MVDEEKSRIDRFATRAYEIYRGSHTLIGFLASLVGLTSVVIWAVQMFTQATWIPATFVCLVGVGAVVTALWMQGRYYEERHQGQRGRRYVRSSPALAKYFEHLRDADSYSGARDDLGRVRQEGERAVIQLARAFSILTGSACRVTVKQIFPVPGTNSVEGREEVGVQDLFRSEPRSDSHRGSGTDLLRDNLDFVEVVDAALRPWISADITREPGYTNSHITPEQLRQGDVPYRSVLVVAIRGRTLGEQPGEPGERVTGFLCVDSLSRDIFRRDPDVATARACADALYSVLKWFEDRQQQATQEVGPHASQTE